MKHKENQLIFEAYAKSKKLNENSLNKIPGLEDKNVIFDEDPANFVTFSDLNDEEEEEVSNEQNFIIKTLFSPNAFVDYGPSDSHEVVTKVSDNGRNATVISGYEYGSPDIYHYINFY